MSKLVCWIAFLLCFFVLCFQIQIFSIQLHWVCQKKKSEGRDTHPCTSVIAQKILYEKELSESTWDELLVPQDSLAVFLFRGTIT